eukprot:CAMPEP_0171469208 /NCGR_PEP_ID=MMETSP0945-20130129/11143_1 /TAXON_ID=109269 /ORGANISM="Vaucheria litorea, Strain CCMP2940" /LENGTH=800 /DNA_ID=CAMNT_0011998299 /DNA_START=113 /DNA_END=2512 /DNA_ORIENTATION=-
MKRTLSSENNGTPKVQGKTKLNPDSDSDSSFFLKHQNQALVTELFGYKRVIKELEGELKKSHKRQRALDHSVSVVNRIWDQLENDLKNIALNLKIDIEAPFRNHPEKVGSKFNPSLLLNLMKASGQLSTIDITNSENLKSYLNVKLPDVPKDQKDFIGWYQSSYESWFDAENCEQIDQKVRGALQKRVDFTKRLLAEILSRLGQQGETGDATSQERENTAVISCLTDSLTYTLQKQVELKKELIFAKRLKHQATRRLAQLFPDEVDGDKFIETDDSDSKANSDDAAGNGMETDDVLPKKECATAESSSVCDDLREVAERRLQLLEESLEKKIDLENEITKLRLSINNSSESNNALPNHDIKKEVFRLNDELNRKTALLECTKARIEDAEKESKYEKKIREELEKKIYLELSAIEEKWRAQVEGSNVAMGDAMLGYDSIKAEVEMLKQHISRFPEISVTLESANKRIQIETEEVERLKKRLQRANETISELEKKLSKLSKRDDCGEGSDERGLKAALDEKEQELRKSKDMVEIVMKEVEETGKALEEALEESQKLSLRITGYEKNIKILTAELAENKCMYELVNTQKSAMEWRCFNAETLKAKSETLTENAKKETAEYKAQLEASKETVSKLLKSLSEEKEARNMISASLARTKALHGAEKKNTEEIRARCNQLLQREKEAALSEMFSKEQASSMMKKYDKLKEKFEREKSSPSVENGKAAPSSVTAASAEKGKEGDALVDEVRELRRILNCSVCSSRQKDCVINKCFHMFCRECLEGILRNRQRKCPACGKAFGFDNIHS